MQEVQNIQLSPIIEPSPIPFTMETIGWKFVFALLLIVILFSIYKYLKYYKSNAYRREAISQINLLNTNSNLSSSQLIESTMFQLKKTAIQSYGRKKVAALYGKEWLLFLEESVQEVSFQPYYETIHKSLYNKNLEPTTSFNKNQFVNASVNWIKKHAR